MVDVNLDIQAIPVAQVCDMEIDCNIYLFNIK